MTLDTTFEKNKLKAYLGFEMYDSLKKVNAIIAGGMITSLFNNKEINDVDIYFRDYDSLYLFAKDYAVNNRVVSHTSKATQFIKEVRGHDVLIQLIHYRTYNNVIDIFETFDFTVCMGAYDFESEEFILHQDFLKHNSQRVLRFNSNTSYPIISAIRTQKYEDKGYTISKAEYLRIIMTCMALDIKSYDKLKEHLGGMYGESYDRLFEDVNNEEYSLVEAIDRISNLTKLDSYFTEYEPLNIRYIELLNDLDKGTKYILKLKKGNFRDVKGNVFNIHGKYHAECITELDVNEYYEGKKFYKFVNKKENGLFSFYNDLFEYKIGEVVAAQNKWTKYGRDGVLYFNRFENIRSSTYHNRDGAVLIELEVVGDNMVEDNGFEATATKVKVIREVPRDEWADNDMVNLPFLIN